MIRTFSSTVRVAAGFAVFALLMMTIPATAKTVFPISGGSGDAGFQDHCPANQYLTGVAGRTGTVVDQIQIICSPLLPDGTHGASTYGPLRGGSGGASQEFSCSADSFVTGAIIYWNDSNNIVTTVNLNCSASRAHGASFVGLHSGNTGTLFLNQDEECPSGELATGFAGRYGKNLNALGLYCDTSSVTSAPVTGTAPSAYPIRTTGKVAGSTSSLGGSAGCPQGLFWREASPTDHVCVNVGQHLLTLQENRAAPSHVSQTDHTYGPNTCAAGYVWRAAYPGDVVCVTPDIRQMVADENRYSASLNSPAPTSTPAHTMAGSCPSGYVWREASPTDHVCVTPIVRTLTAAENKNAASHVSKTDHTYGPNTCAPGFVWRAAYSGDAVCVTPADRQAAADQNKNAPPLLK